MRTVPPTKTSGFTLIEMAVALVLLVVVVGNVYTMLRQSSKSLGSQNAAFDVDQQCRRTMDRIAMAIIGAKESELQVPVAQPGFTNYLRYKESLGMQNGVMAESALQQIAYTNVDGGEVTWFENPGDPDQKRIIFSHNVPPLLEKELSNGVDDNQNGIVDETGLAFVKNGKSITIYLTIRRTFPNGETIERQLNETVTCRN